MNAIFQGNLASNLKKKGYQVTFPDFVKILKSSATSLSQGGPVMSPLLFLTHITCVCMSTDVMSQPLKSLFHYKMILYL